MRLAEALVAGIGRMREDRADRIVDRDRPEFHAASSFLRRPAPRVRSALMISASTATAISAGLDAPMSMPIGEWMRPIWSAVSAQRQQPFDALGVGLAAAQRADIEAAGVERGLQREIVDLGIMRQRGERGVAVERPRLQHVLRPFGMERHVGKAVRRGEGRARIDDLHVEAGDPRHRRQRLADMHRADRDQLAAAARAR